MPGPPPKSPGRRQRSNTPSLDVVVTPPATPGAAAPRAPPASKGWRADTKRDWRAVWADPLIVAIYNPSTDLPSLYRLFKLRDDRARCEEAFDKEPLVTGSQGQKVLNPQGRLIPGLDRAILSLEDRFGLNPKARLGLGVTLGKAKRSLDDMAGGGNDDEPPEEADPRETAIVARSRHTKT